MALARKNFLKGAYCGKPFPPYISTNSEDWGQSLYVPVPPPLSVIRMISEPKHSAGPKVGEIVAVVGEDTRFGNNSIGVHYTRDIEQLAELVRIERVSAHTMDIFEIIMSDGNYLQYHLINGYGLGFESFCIGHGFLCGEPTPDLCYEVIGAVINPFYPEALRRAKIDLDPSINVAYYEISKQNNSL